MTRLALLLGLVAGLAAAGVPARADTPLRQPRLTLPAGPHQQPHIALTLDACTGKADERIFGALIANRIPATVFVTARWLRRNATATQLMRDNPDLFQIENHGARHLPAVDEPQSVYGIPGAGSPAAVTAEVTGGAAAVMAATGRAPAWFRGATARYTPGAIREIEATGEAVAGYSLAADDGATLSAKGVEARLAQAKSGDVIIAHVNHPEKPAGAGLVSGILTLKARGFLFVKLGAPPPRKPAPAHQS